MMGGLYLNMNHLQYTTDWVLGDELNLSPHCLAPNSQDHPLTVPHGVLQMIGFFPSHVVNAILDRLILSFV